MKYLVSLGNLGSQLEFCEFEQCLVAHQEHVMRFKMLCDKKKEKETWPIKNIIIICVHITDSESGVCAHFLRFY